MKNGTDANALWSIIASSLHKQPRDIQTIKQDGSGGLWFSAEVVDDTLYIDNTRQRTPSSKLASNRAISREEFMRVYPLYYSWKTGSVSRVQVTKSTQNSSYIFAIIHNFEDSK